MWIALPVLFFKLCSCSTNILRFSLVSAHFSKAELAERFSPCRRELKTLLSLRGICLPCSAFVTLRWFRLAHIRISAIQAGFDYCEVLWSLAKIFVILLSAGMACQSGELLTTSAGFVRCTSFKFAIGAKNARASRSFACVFCCRSQLARFRILLQRLLAWFCSSYSVLLDGGFELLSLN